MPNKFLSLCASIRGEFLAPYRDKDGGANSRLGNGRLTPVKPKKALSDAFAHGPMRSVSSLGTHLRCFVVAHNVIPRDPAYLSKVVLQVARSGSAGGST
jgi:hypothetical protein